MEVKGLLVVSHQYLWGVWIYRKFCSHDLIIELRNHILDNFFYVHIFTLMKILDILKLRDIPWSNKISNQQRYFVDYVMLSSRSRTFLSFSFTQCRILQCISSIFLSRFSASCEFPLSFTISSRCLDTYSPALSPYRQVQIRTRYTMASYNSYFLP